MYRYNRIFWDWALGSTLSSVFGYTALIDGIFFAWDGMQSIARLAKQLGDDATVVTVFADCSKKYLSTDLYRCEAVKDEYVAPGIQLRNWRSVSSEVCGGH